MIYKALKQKRMYAFIIYALVLLFPNIFLIIGLLTSPSYVPYILVLYVIVTLLMTGYLILYLEKVTADFINRSVTVDHLDIPFEIPRQIPLQKPRQRLNGKLFYRYKKYEIPKSFIEIVTDTHLCLYQPLLNHDSNEVYRIKAIFLPLKCALIMDRNYQKFLIDLRHIKNSV